jgi:hypothetical protein
VGELEQSPLRRAVIERAEHVLRLGIINPPHLVRPSRRLGIHETVVFFIVDGAAGGDVPAEWQEHAEATISRDALEESLPHRSGKPISRNFIT